MIKKRNLNLDILRILACFMVVMIHVSAHNFYKTDIYSYNFFMFNIFDSLASSAVPLFLMISGYFFLSKKKIDIKTLFTKNIFKLICIYFVWSIIYSFFLLFVTYNRPLTLYNYVDMFLNRIVHFWYIPLIIGLYIITPIIKNIVNKCNDSYAKYFFIVFLIASFLDLIMRSDFLPYFKYINIFLSKFNINYVCNPIGYFVLGYLIYNTNYFDNNKKIFYSLGIISLITSFIGTMFLCMYTGKIYTYLYETMSIFIIFEAIAIFLFFKNYNFKKLDKYKDKIYKISTHTLGIYIIHQMIINVLDNIFNITSISFNPILSIPILTIFIFLISYLIIFILKKVKIINKYLI